MSKYKITFDFGYDEEEIAAATEVLKDNRWVWSREQTEMLSKEFCHYFGSKYAIPVSNGSMGLCCILAALGVGAGDEVITSANTNPSVPMYIICLGARPVLVDADEEIQCIDPDLIEKEITPKTKALMPVHTAGHPFDIDPVWEIAEKHGLPVIHDAAQAMGAKYKDKFLGQFPDVTVFSFAKHKHVCVGGGIVLTDDEEFYDRIWAKVMQGFPRDSQGILQESGTQIPNDTWGFHARMHEVIAAISRVQFRKFREGPQRVELRRETAQLYDRLLADMPEIKTPIEKEWAYHSYCRYIVRAKRRDELFKYLHKEGIQVFIHYGIPIHMQPFMINLYGHQEGMYPITEKTKKEILTLPSWPYQTTQQKKYTVQKIMEFYK